MSAREAILRRLSGGPAGDIRAEADALLRGPERPAIDRAGLVEAFADRLAGPSVSATLDRVARLEDVPGVVRRYLEEAGMAGLYLPPNPLLASLDWSGLQIESRCAIDGGAALAVASAAVAETGTLVLDTTPTAPMLPNFLALHHIVLVRRETLVVHLEDVPPPAGWPRARYWITGVSGTTDIEGQYVRGAHGPRFLHVLLIG
ncbi:MAG: LUD domain-containing protein [Sphingomonas sp.]|uniref:LutC/YkgG family protein n=1 Tax=Sphingomonas sp. TaxID=28214 RepID=UPI001B2C76BE|nr:LUD domain-containing protein [Sphingomonas sp.]MBO9622541.1 LUD domain-containing protein [Sphingomonas sp.]